MVTGSHDNLTAESPNHIGDTGIIGCNDYPGKHFHLPCPFHYMLDHGFAVNQGQGFSLKSVGVIARGNNRYHMWFFVFHIFCITMNSRESSSR